MTTPRQYMIDAHLTTARRCIDAIRPVTLSDEIILPPYAEIREALVAVTAAIELVASAVRLLADDPGP